MLATQNAKQQTFVLSYIFTVFLKEFGAASYRYDQFRFNLSLPSYNLIQLVRVIITGI